MSARHRAISPSSGDLFIADSGNDVILGEVQAAAPATVTVGQATPTISWATPAPITYGTALSSTQLDATANVAGNFAYTPAAGTVLTAGSQTLSASFTPTDTTDYTRPPDTVTLQVNKATPTSLGPPRRRSPTARP